MELHTRTPGDTHAQPHARPRSLTPGHAPAEPRTAQPQGCTGRYPRSDIQTPPQRETPTAQPNTQMPGYTSPRKHPTHPNTAAHAPAAARTHAEVCGQRAPALTRAGRAHSLHAHADAPGAARPQTLPKPPGAPGPAPEGQELLLGIGQGQPGRTRPRRGCPGPARVHFAALRTRAAPGDAPSPAGTLRPAPGSAPRPSRGAAGGPQHVYRPRPPARSRSRGRAGDAPGRAGRHRGRAPGAAL